MSYWNYSRQVLNLAQDNLLEKLSFFIKASRYFYQQEMNDIQDYTSYMDYTIPCIIDVEFSRHVPEYATIVKPDELLVYLNELKAMEKRMVSIFIAEKLNLIMKPSKKYIITVQADLKRKDFPMWDILLAKPVDWVIIHKEHKEQVMW